MSTITTTIRDPELPLYAVSGPSSDEVAQAHLDEELAELQAAARQADPDDRLAQVAELLSRAAGTNPLTGAPRYTAEDVLSWAARAVELGCSTPFVDYRHTGRIIREVFRLQRVPNARLREEYERQVADGEEGLDARIARALGATKGGSPDTTYVLRTLGIEPTPDGKGGLPTLRLLVSYEVAVALADALDLDYHSIGV